MITKLNNFRKRINENHSIVLNQINRLDKFFLHSCKDQTKLLAWEDASAEFLSQFSTPHWATAVNEDEMSVQSLLDEWLPQAEECGFNLATVQESKKSIKHPIFDLMTKLPNGGSYSGTYKQGVMLQKIADKYGIEVAAGVYEADVFGDYTKYYASKAYDKHEEFEDLVQKYKTITENVNSNSITQIMQQAITAQMNQTDEEILTDFAKNLAAFGKDAEDVGQQYAEDPNFSTRLCKEWRSDCKFALENLQEFIEMCGPRAESIAKNPEELGPAIASYANNGDPLEYLPESLKIKESAGAVMVSLPNIETTEQLIEHISNNVQKAMDIFAAQQKIPQLTVSIKNGYFNIISKTFEEDELGIFKHGVSKAQIQAANSSKISVNSDKTFQQILWGTFSIRYEILGGGSNGVNYMYADNDNQFMYDVLENKFYTRNNYFAKLEKRQTGYNTKRIK